MNVLFDEPVVFVLDDDTDLCGAVEQAAKDEGFRAERHATADDFFQAFHPSQLGCLVADLGRPESGGLDLFRRLAEKQVHLPVIVVSVNGDVQAVVRAMRAGAFDYAQKPCDPRRLGDLVAAAVAWDRANHQAVLESFRSHRRIARLNEGERQVLDLLLGGLSNRETAEQLRLSVRAIEDRRSRIMEKMRARSLADLVRQAVLTQVSGFRGACRTPQV
jgi:FixJ family two-component response regulator